MAPSDARHGRCFHLARGGELLRADKLEAARARSSRPARSAARPARQTSAPWPVSARGATPRRSRSTPSCARRTRRRGAAAQPRPGRCSRPATPRPRRTSWRRARAGRAGRARPGLPRPGLRAGGRFGEARDAFHAAGQEELAHDMEERMAQRHDLRRSARISAAPPTSRRPTSALELPETGAVVRRCARPSPPPPSRASTACSPSAPSPPRRCLAGRPDGRLAGAMGEPFALVEGGMLVVRVDGRMPSRTEGVLVSGGALAFEPVTRRVGATAHRQAVRRRRRRDVLRAGHRAHRRRAARREVHRAALADDIVYLREYVALRVRGEAALGERARSRRRARIPRGAACRGTGASAMRARGAPLTSSSAPHDVLVEAPRCSAGSARSPRASSAGGGRGGRRRTSSARAREASAAADPGGRRAAG